MANGFRYVSDLALTSLFVRLGEVFRPYLASSDQGATLYVETTGDDANDGLTIGTPVATYGRVLQLVASLNSSTVTVQFGGGTFEIPRLLQQVNNMTLLGTLSVTSSMSIVSGSVVVSDGQILVDVTGITVAADDLEGDLIEYTNTAGTPKGSCFRNLATGALAPGETRLFLTQDAAGAMVAPPNDGSGTLDQLSRDTTLSMAAGGSSSWMMSVQFNVRDLRLISSEGTRALNILVTDKIEFRNVLFESMQRPSIGGFGRGYFINSYVATGGNAGAGMLTVTNGGFLLFQRGSVIDADLNSTAAGRAFIEASGGGTLAFQGTVVVRGIEEFQVDGVGGFIAGGIGDVDQLRFDDNNGAGATCLKAFVINTTGEGLSGFYQLPNLFGSISGPYMVEASGCACVVVGTGISSLATSGVTNAVSADGGTTPSSISPDTTVILRGVPAFVGFAQRFFYPTSTVIASDTALIFQRMVFDPTAGTFTISAPASPSQGDQFSAKNVSTNATAITISGNGNTIQDPSAGFSVVASFSFGGSGIAATWEYDGTRWLTI